MKKILLSAIVILAFVAYAIHQQSENEGSNVVPPSGVSSQPNSQNQLTTPPLNATSSTPPPTQGSTNTSSGQYKDGEYTGSVTDAFYGNVQVKAIVSGGKITDVQFLQYPNDRQTSQEINSQAMPYLKSEAIQAQSANVQIVSGATQTSQAFQQSLQAALDQAKA